MSSQTPEDAGELMLTDFSDIELEIANLLRVELPDPDKGIFVAGGCLCRRTERSEGRACGKHSEAIFRVFAMRDFLAVKQTKSYEQGRIAEAKTCEAARRHDLKQEQTKLLEDIEGELPAKFDDRDKESEVATAFAKGRNEALDQVRSLLAKKKEGLRQMLNDSQGITPKYLHNTLVHGCTSPCPTCNQGCIICHPCEPGKHGTDRITTYPYPPPLLPKGGEKCDLCGSTAIDHTEIHCQFNRAFQQLGKKS